MIVYNSYCKENRLFFVAHEGQHQHRSTQQWTGRPMLWRSSFSSPIPKAAINSISSSSTPYARTPLPMATKRSSFLPSSPSYETPRSYSTTRAGHSTRQHQWPSDSCCLCASTPWVRSSANEHSSVVTREKKGNGKRKMGGLMRPRRSWMKKRWALSYCCFARRDRQRPSSPPSLLPRVHSSCAICFDRCSLTSTALNGSSPPSALLPLVLLLLLLLM